MKQTPKNQTNPLEASTLFPGGSHNHANPTPLQEKEKAMKMTAISGRKCLEQLQKFSQPGLLGKMFLASLIGKGEWYSQKSTLTWKLRGLKYSHLLYCQLVVKTHRIEGTGFGLLPTPKTLMPGESNPNIVNNRTVRRNGKDYGINLQVMASQGLLPTPTAISDAKGGCTRPNKKRQNDTLAHSMHEATGAKSGTTSQLNPRFVAEMMGYPVDWLELPFQNTEQKA